MQQARTGRRALHYPIRAEAQSVQSNISTLWRFPPPDCPICRLSKDQDRPDQGDRVAQSIVRRLANEIVTAASAFLRRLDMEAMDVDVVLSGGLTQGAGALLVDTVTAQLAERHPLAKLRRVSVAPVLGAALLAFDGLHITPRDVSTIRLPEPLLTASMPG